VCLKRTEDLSLKKSTRYLIVIVCLLLAMACYAVGMARGTGFFILVGLYLNSPFGMASFQKRNKQLQQH